MPIYEYQCLDCEGRDQRVAGLDDHLVLCPQCGGLMMRLDKVLSARPSRKWPKRSGLRSKLKNPLKVV